MTYAKTSGNFHFSHSPAPNSWWLAPKISGLGEDVCRGNALGIRARLADGLDQFVAIKLHLDHDADVVDQPTKERLVGKPEFQAAREHLGGGGGDVGVCPDVTSGEVGREFATTEQLRQAGRDGDVSDGVEPEHDDRRH